MLSNFKRIPIKIKNAANKKPYLVKIKTFVKNFVTSPKYSINKTEYLQLINSKLREEKVLQKAKILELKKTNSVLKQRNLDLKNANFALKLLQPNWIKFLSTSVIFGQNVVQSLLAHDFKADLAIGHEVTCLEALHTIKRTFHSTAIFDAREYTEIKERIGLYYRNFPLEGLEINQERIDSLIQQMDHVCTVGPSIAEELSKKYGREVFVLANARRKGFFENSKEIRTLISAKETDIVCVFPNTIHALGGFNEVAQAFKVLPKHFKLVHIGRIEAGYQSALNTLLADEGLKNRVFLLKSVNYEDFPALLSGADLGIICSEFSCKNVSLGYPNRFHDLIAAGIPIFSSPILDIQHAVEKFNLGKIFKDNDPQTIVNTLNSEIKNLPTYQKNVGDFQKTHIWEIHVNELLKRIPSSISKVVCITRRDVTNDGRLKRIFDSLSSAGKEVKIVASAGHFINEEYNKHLYLASDGIK